MTNKKGFTLIELLVVIAIIGVLSSVVLTSLNSARSKGNDAKVKAQIAGARAAAEIFYDSNNQSYGTAGISAPAAGAACTGNMFTNVASGMATYGASANYPSGTELNCVQNAGTGYSLTGKLSTGANKWWCVDGAGAAREVTAARAGISGATSADDVDTCAEIDALAD